MEITVAQALAMLPTVFELGKKLTTIITTNTAMSAEEEIAALETARMRPAEEVIADADKKAL
jgi:hypothetical protein